MRGWLLETPDSTRAVGSVRGIRKMALLWKRNIERSERWRGGSKDPAAKSAGCYVAGDVLT
jgi:hypothetical protein